ncbi:DUF6249 domain-containing protein [Chitinophaga flava]|uniref:DUF6249 domain-containing protein n=1 Tax=Chitinophaga flava TaxID=2259036 RepID=A0A365XZ27_9BACT|nr:DUF6249 domain-containing protein [Chitinophaga flava]RBL91251.1 hypothetical protein DF182_01095 [Chitinophaga flava]
MQTTSAAFFIALSLATFGISYYYFTTRHKERIAIIEKGLPADFFKGTVDFKPLILTLGIVCISITLGLVAGLFSMPTFPILGGFVIIFFIFLFTGLGLLLSYFLLKKLHKRK